MKVVSVINYKGGVGKTTLTANLGAYAAYAGKRVLMIDLDPQTQLTFSFMTPEEWREKYAADKTLKNYFTQIIESSNIIPSLSSLAIKLNLFDSLGLENMKCDLISSHLNLIDIDINLAALVSTLNRNIWAAGALKNYSHLKNSLMNEIDNYDLVLIDCPPNFNMSVKNAMFASDYYIIPAKLDYLSILGIDNLTHNVNNFLDECREHISVMEYSTYKPPLISVLGVVPMMVNVLKGDEVISVQQKYMREIKQKDYHVFQFVRNNPSVFGVYQRDGIPVVLTKPKFSLSARKIVAELKLLGEEFLKMVFND